MSGTFPSSPAFSSLDITSIQPTMVSRTISGRRQARQIAGQYFGMRASFPPMTREQFAPIHAFVMKQRGQYETFQLILPVLSTGLGKPVGTPLVKGASQTGRSIITDGWSNRATGNAGTITDTTPTATWTASQTSTNNPVLGTSGSGTGLLWSSTTDGSGNPTITVTDGGSGYEVGDTVQIRDPSATPTADIAVITIATVDKAGILTLLHKEYYSGPTSQGTMTGNWEDTYDVDEGYHYNVSQTSTSGSGQGAKFTIKPLDWGEGTVAIEVTITNAGSGYAVNDTLLITDPGSTSETITLTVTEVTHNPPASLQFKAGDFLKFANHDKVYTVTSDVESDSSGESTIDIEPALITSPADNSAVTHTNVPFLVSLASGVQEYATNTSGLFAYELDFTEVL